MAERLPPRIPDLEVRALSLACRVVSLDEELYSSWSLFTQVYKQVPATYYWGCGVTLRWTSTPSRGEVATLLCMLYVKETGISSGHLGLWLSSALLPLYSFFGMCFNRKTLFSVYR